MSKKNSNTTNTIVAILSLLFVVAIVAFVFKFTNGLNEDLKTFYIEHNGKQIVATDSQMTFDTESEHRFDCKYISNPDNNTFNLKVVPNVTEETDFNYTVDGKSYKWSEVQDLTACFNIDKQNNFFVISFPVDFSMESILSSLYPESNVVISDSLSLYQYYYTLHVSNYNEKINYYIDFSVSDVVDYVSLINEQIETIAQLDDMIDNLENQISELETSLSNKDTEISELQKQINALNKDKTALEKSLSYYEDYISNLEDAENAVITLEVDGNVYALFTMFKGSTMFDISIPESVDYEFNCWTVNGEQVDLQGYVITDNTTFVADLTHGYDISFVVDGVIVKTERVIEDTLITPPENPVKSGYTFDGWVNTSNTIVDFTTYTACEKMTFTAYFTLNTVNVNFTIKNTSSSSGGDTGSGGTGFNVNTYSATSYWGGVDDGNSSYGSVSPSSVTLSVENQNATVTFTLNSGYTYSDYEVSSTSGGGTGTPYALTSYPFGVSISGNTITITLTYELTKSSNYTLTILVSGTSSGGSSGGGSGSF